MQNERCRFIISELSRLGNYFDSGCFKNIIGTSSMALLILFLVIALLLFNFAYRRGIKPVVRVYSILINPVFAIWPQWPYRHATWTVGILSSFAFIAFIPLTDQLIVNVTAVYATILFLQESLRNEVPLLDVEFVRSTTTLEYDTSIVDGDGDGDVIKQLLKIENYGDLEADNIQLKSRSINEQGKITSDWSSNKISWDNGNQLEPNSETQCEIYVDTVDNYDNQVYLTEVRLKPNVRLGHLIVRKIQWTRPESN
jgi:hypothetical protein